MIQRPDQEPERLDVAALRDRHFTAAGIDAASSSCTCIPRPGRGSRRSRQAAGVTGFRGRTRRARTRRCRVPGRREWHAGAHRELALANETCKARRLVTRRVLCVLLGVGLFAACGSGGSSGGARPTVSRPTRQPAPASRRRLPRRRPHRRRRRARPVHVAAAHVTTDEPTRDETTRDEPSRDEPARDKPANEHPPSYHPAGGDHGAPAITTTTAPSGSVAPASSSSSESNDWIWIVILLVIALLALLAYLWWRRRRQLALAAEQWHNELATTIASAKTAGDQLHEAAGGQIEPDRLVSLRHEADAVAAAFARLSTSAPDDNARTLTDAAEKRCAAIRWRSTASSFSARNHRPHRTTPLADANVTPARPRRRNQSHVDRARHSAAGGARRPAPSSNAGLVQPPDSEPPQGVRQDPAHEEHFPLERRVDPARIVSSRSSARTMTSGFNAPLAAAARPWMLNVSLPVSSSAATESPGMNSSGNTPSRSSSNGGCVRCSRTTPRGCRATASPWRPSRATSRCRIPCRPARRAAFLLA